MEYVSKPTRVEAIQYRHDINLSVLSAFVKGSVLRMDDREFIPFTICIGVEGRGYMMNINDWIVKHADKLEVLGEADFERRYEIAPDALPEEN